MDITKSILCNGLDMLWSLVIPELRKEMSTTSVVDT